MLATAQTPAIVFVIELAVGAGCLTAGAGVARSGTSRLLGLVLGVAGLAAVVHAGIALVNG